MEKFDSKKLIKWIYFIPIVSITVTIIIIAAIFIYRENTLHNKEVLSYRSSMIRLEKIASKDRINRVIKQIEINHKIINKESKKNVKDMVNFAYNIIQDIYRQNKNLPKKKILQKIKNRLRDVRFFHNLSGYFFIYDMKGTCILLPIKPSFEGKNLLFMKDATGKELIKDTINELKDKNAFFESWYWYKPGCKTMKKKIGYIKEFKPLHIFIGSAFYVDDVLKKVKKVSLKIIRRYRYGKKGYIFAMDLNGVILSHIRKSFIGKNMWNYVSKDHRYMIRIMAKNAKKYPKGFYVDYIASIDPVTKKPARKISFVRMVPGFHYFIGTGFYIKDIIKNTDEKYSLLKNELKTIIANIIYISLFMIILLTILMVLVANRIKKILLEYENNMSMQYKQISEQKRMFKLLFEKAKDAIFLSKDKKFLDCNEMAIEMFEAKDKKDLLSHSSIEMSSKYQPDGTLSRDKMLFLIQKAENEGVSKSEWLAKSLKGKTFYIEMVITAIRLENGIMLHTACRDITKRKIAEKALMEKEKELMQLARYDILTKLPNRSMFYEIANSEIFRARREKDIFALFFMDLDGFKEVNDLYGHDSGDKLLQECAERFRRYIRESDFVFRFGGDEFVAVIRNCKDENDIAHVANKIVNSFVEPFKIDKHKIKVGVSIGVVLYPQDGMSVEELLRNGDIAMYKAKEEGKGKYVFYQDRMYERILKRHSLEEDLKQAIINDEFILYYQPKIDVLKHKIVGFEALVRWKKDGKIVPPGYFINIASQSNIIKDIGLIVMRKAMRFMVNLKNRGYNIGRISINLADRQLKDDNLLEKIKQEIKESGCDTKLIEFEITEGFIMSDLEKSYILLKELRKIGIKISMDDFGTGYSSLAYLKTLPFDIIKIDQSFMRDIPGFKEDEAIVSAIIKLGNGLGLKIIAEGVENVSQENFILKKGCHIIQGYLYSKPIPEEDVITYIKNFNRG